MSVDSRNEKSSFAKTTEKVREKEGERVKRQAWRKADEDNLVTERNRHFDPRLPLSPSHTLSLSLPLPLTPIGMKTQR